MRLHCDVRIQVIQGSVGLLATLPPAFVHALDFFVATTRTLVLLRTRDRDKRIHLGQWVRILYTTFNASMVNHQASCLPGLFSVQQLLPVHQRKRRFLESCMVLPACHEDAQRTAGASHDGCTVGDLGIGTCRVPAGRTANTADTWGSTRLWMDL